MQFGLSALYKERDAHKRTVCAEGGLTLVEIPYWWDNTIVLPAPLTFSFSFSLSFSFLYLILLCIAFLDVPPLP